DLHVLEIRPVRRLIAEPVGQIDELQSHAVVGVLLERHAANFFRHVCPPCPSISSADYRPDAQTRQHAARGTVYCPGLYSSGLALAILMRVSAACRSCLRNATNSAGVVGAETTACLSRKATNCGSANSFANALLSRVTISGGKPFGAARPHQPWPG